MGLVPIFENMVIAVILAAYDIREMSLDFLPDFFGACILFELIQWSRCKHQQLFWMLHFLVPKSEEDDPVPKRTIWFFIIYLFFFGESIGKILINIKYF